VLSEPENIERLSDEYVEQRYVTQFPKHHINPFIILFESVHNTNFFSFLIPNRIKLLKLIENGLTRRIHIHD
jgi:hypothetical protein